MFGMNHVGYTNLEVALFKRLQVTYTHKQRIGNTAYTNSGKLNNLRWSKLKPRILGIPRKCGYPELNLVAKRIKFSRKTACPNFICIKQMDVDAETKTSLRSSSIDMLAVANGKAFELMPFWKYG